MDTYSESTARWARAVEILGDSADTPSGTPSSQAGPSTTTDPITRDFASTPFIPPPPPPPPPLPGAVQGTSNDVHPLVQYNGPTQGIVTVSARSPYALPSSRPASNISPFSAPSRQSTQPPPGQFTPQFYQPPPSLYGSPSPYTSSSPAPSPYQYGQPLQQTSQSISSPAATPSAPGGGVSSYSSAPSQRLYSAPQQMSAQSAPAQMYQPSSASAPNRQSTSLYGTPQPFTGQSQSPAPYSYTGPTTLGQSLSTPATNNTIKKPTRKKSDAFVANDPYRPHGKVDKTDELTFDDIPIAGSGSAPKPTSQPPLSSQYGDPYKPSQSSSQTPVPNSTSWYRPSTSGTYNEPSNSQSNSYGSAGPATPYRPPTQSQTPLPQGPQSYPSSQSPYSPAQPGKHSSPYTVQPYTPLPIQSYPVTIDPVPFPYSSPSGPVNQLPSGPPVMSPPPSSPLYPHRPITPEPSEIPAAGTPYDPYQTRYSPPPSPPMEPYRPLETFPGYDTYPIPSYPPYNPNGPLTPPRRSIRFRLGRFIRHPFSSSKRNDYIFNEQPPRPPVIYPDNQSVSSTEIAFKFVVGTLPNQVYLHILLRLPSLYFSRVARIFEEADLTLPEIKKMALETASEGKGSIRTLDFHTLESMNVPPQYEKLKSTWESFIDSVMREWKTFNIISVLLLSAILTILQIDAAAADPVTRYAALFSLICALISLLFGCMYIIRFGSMRKTYKAAEWALEAQRTKGTWWNVWVLLAMPAIWLTWSLILYIVCIMSFVWRTGAPDAPPPPVLSHEGILAVRIVITVVLALGLLYGFLIIGTFRRYGEAMDKAWKERIDGWLEEKAANANQQMLQPALGTSPYYAASTHQPTSLGPQIGDNSSSAYPSAYRPPPPPPQSQDAPAYSEFGYGYSADTKVHADDVRPPYTAYLPQEDLADNRSHSSTPESSTSTVNVTRANTLQNAELRRKASTNSMQSAIYNGPGYETSNPLPIPPQAATLTDIPPPPKLVPKLAVPPPPSLPPIPGTPMTALPDQYSGYSGRFLPSDEDSDFSGHHVHFRSPLLSAHGSSDRGSMTTPLPEPHDHDQAVSSSPRPGLSESAAGKMKDTSEQSDEPEARKY